MQSPRLKRNVRKQMPRIALAILLAFLAAPIASAQRRLPPVAKPKPVKLPDVGDASTDRSPRNQVAVHRNVAWDLPDTTNLDWWNEKVGDDVLAFPRWVSFDLQTVLMDTLRLSPRIKAVSSRTSVALERIVQQDAVFDPSMLFESTYGRTNDPVGNALTTGGPPRLIEESWTTRGGVKQTGRRGTELNLGQEVGLLDSNSQFFQPINQGNARLNLSLVQPLLDRGGQVYNERLLTQARIDGNVSWQEMRGDVEKRIADVINAYWRLYELRCHLLQQTELLKRGERIEEILIARHDFDSARIEMAKARQRVARRVDRRLQIYAAIAKQQTQLAALVGADELAGAAGKLELIPIQTPVFPELEIELRDAVLQGIENRPEVRAATEELESAALSIRVTRVELLPELTAVVDTYLMGLNGSSDVLRSFGDQFTRGGPGISAGIQYELPVGRRAARSRHREAHHRYQQRSEELREAIQLTRAEIETAIISIDTAIAQQRTKRRLLETAIEEETVLTRRWEMMGGDGAAVGTVLENLLDAQQRRTEAEREWTTAQVQYRTSLVELQRGMGTLLTREGIRPVKEQCGTTIDFIRDVIQPGAIPPDVMMRVDKAIVPDLSNEPASTHGRPETIEPGVIENPIPSPREQKTNPLPAPRIESPSDKAHAIVMPQMSGAISDRGRQTVTQLGETR